MKLIGLLSKNVARGYPLSAVMERAVEQTREISSDPDHIAEVGVAASHRDPLLKVTAHCNC